MLVDPVCGMSVAHDAPLVHVHQGTTYRFCARSCLERFRAEPHKFLAQGRGTARSEPGLAHALHVCPMCAGVHSTGPSMCPKCGMALEPAVVTRDDPFEHEQRAMKRRLFVAAPLAAATMALMLPPLHELAPHGWTAWIEGALATPVVFYAGWPILERGVASLRARSLNMFTLLALGIATAWTTSVIALVAPASGLSSTFEASATITALALLGQVLELGARRKTSAALRELLDLAPKTALVLDPLGRERELPLEKVEPGFVLRVKPGMSVPVDGVVLEGQAAVDESMLTGEPEAVSKGPNQRVVGATLVVRGSFSMIAEKVGHETALARIIALVAQAQRSRAPIQELADRVAAWFVPLVVACAAVAALAWNVAGVEHALARGLVAAVSVLIIACPCALGLATPMSIVVATSRGAREGVLFRDAQALQLLGSIEVLLVDKTGTLTEGQPRLVRIEALEHESEDECLALAASVERSSEHPLGFAIVTAARERGLELHAVANFAHAAGRGVLGFVAGRRVALGNALYLRGLGLDVARADQRAEELARAGRTVTLLGLDERVSAVFAVEDPPRAGAREALAELRAQGLEVHMLTGDRRATAEAVAGELGLEHVHAQATPESKAEIVRELRAARRRVAMAGDGINDAPALAAADVGIAMGGGVDIAKETAAVTLVRGDLRALARSIELSRATLRNIRQNLAFALGYNALCIPLAAGALYPLTGQMLSPMIAALAMTFSSVSVIGNALRLRRARS
ncbi:MAG: heavy metal translocating P-type ATPase [Planctomycetes bacterium]|nr:heavy metal translocating P-type ATPase [Planctomycetota bacterium]